MAGIYDILVSGRTAAAFRGLGMSIYCAFRKNMIQTAVDEDCCYGKQRDEGKRNREKRKTV